MAKKERNTGSSKFVSLADRKKFISTYESSKSSYSPETSEKIDDYLFQLKRLDAYKSSLSNIFSVLSDEKTLPNGEKKKKYPGEYKGFFGILASIIGTPFLIGVAAYILSIKAGGFSQILSSATWAAAIAAVIPAAIISAIAGGTSYIVSRVSNTEAKINKKKQKFDEKNLARASVGKKEKKSILFSIAEKVKTRRLNMSKMTYDMEDSADRIASGDFSFFMDDGKLKDCFKFIPFWKRRKLLSTLAKISECNETLNRLSIIKDDVAKEASSSGTEAKKPTVKEIDIKEEIMDTKRNNKGAEPVISESVETSTSKKKGTEKSKKNSGKR